MSLYALSRITRGSLHKRETKNNFNNTSLKG